MAIAAAGLLQGCGNEVVPYAVDPKLPLGWHPSVDEEGRLVYMNEELNLQTEGSPLGLMSDWNNDRVNVLHHVFSVLDMSQDGRFELHEAVDLMGADIGYAVFHLLDLNGAGYVTKQDLEDFPGSLAAVFAQLPRAAPLREELLHRSLQLEEELGFARLFKAMHVAMKLDGFAADEVVQGGDVDGMWRNYYRLEFKGHRDMTDLQEFVSREAQVLQDFLDAHRSEGETNDDELFLLNCAKDIMTLLVECSDYMDGYDRLQAEHSLGAAVDIRAPVGIIAPMLNIYRGLALHSHPNTTVTIPFDEKLVLFAEKLIESANSAR